MNVILRGHVCPAKKQRRKAAIKTFTAFGATALCQPELFLELG